MNATDAKRDLRVIMRLTSELVRAIDDYRFQARLPTRADAIRALLIAGLKSTAKPKG